MSANKAAAELNRRGIATPKGAQWHAESVFDRMDTLPDYRPINLLPEHVVEPWLHQIAGIGNDETLTEQKN
jgi:hypothetical protein